MIDFATFRQSLYTLYDAGHFSNPVYPSTLGVAYGDLAILTPDDSVVQDAGKSYQDFYAVDIEPLAQAFHGRALRIDGDIGPATAVHLQQPRMCPVPDFRRDGPEERNIPTTCRMEITTSYRFTGIDPGMAARALVDALRSWEEVIAVKFDIRSAFSRGHRIWATDEPMSGSTLGWSYLTDGTCSRSIEQRYNSSYRWNQPMLQGTEAHEYGHALGLSHVSGRTLMNATAVEGVITPQAADIRAALALGYTRATGEPVEPPPVEPPPVEPPPVEPPPVEPPPVEPPPARPPWCPDLTSDQRKELQRLGKQFLSHDASKALKRMLRGE